LNSEREFLDLVFAVDFGLLFSLSSKALLFLSVVVLARHVVVVVSLPESQGGFSPLDVFVRLLLQVVHFQVTVSHDVVLTKTSCFYSFAPYALRLVQLRTLLRGCKVVLLHINVANDVVICARILPGTEIPGLLLGIVRPLLKTFHLALKIEDVIGLLVPKRTVLAKVIC